MGLYKRGSVWWMTYTLDGRQRCESTGTSNKRLARMILDKRKGEVVERRFNIPAKNPQKLTEWAEHFLQSIVHPNTKRTYQTSVTMLNKFFGPARLSDISASRIEEYKQNRTKGGTGPARINRDLAVLRRMLKLASRQRLIGHSPFDASGIEFLNERSQRRQAHILTFEEQARLVAAAPPRLRLLIVLLTETGLRIGAEALKLKWDDIDFVTATIQVHQSKTAAGRRIVPLSDYCQTALLEWKKLCGPDFSEYLFPSLPNTRHPLQSGRKTWARALKAANIDHFPIYNLRATFASRLSAAGIPDVFVSQMMGHAGGLLQTYARAIDEYRREAISKLERYRQSAETRNSGLPDSAAVLQ